MKTGIMISTITTQALMVLLVAFASSSAFAQQMARFDCASNPNEEAKYRLTIQDPDLPWARVVAKAKPNVELDNTTDYSIGYNRDPNSKKKYPLVYSSGLIRILYCVEI